MAALTISVLVVAIHLVLGLLAPGFLLESLCRPLRRPGEALSCLVSRVLALGSLWLMVWFFAVNPAMLQWRVPPHWLTAALWLIGLAALVALVTWRRRDFSEVARQLAREAAQPLTLAVVLLAMGVAALGIFRCPYALDNAALGWTGRALDGSITSFGDSQGSPAYIALLYFPAAVTWPGIPVPTTGAALKIPLCLLAALAAMRLAASLPFRFPRAIGAGLFLVLIGSFFGVYGMFETGKETPFGIALLMIFVGELLDADSREWAWAVRAGLVLCAAFGFGAITIPYAIPLVGIFLAANIGRVRTFEFSFWLLACTALPLVFSIYAMTHVALWKAAVLVAVLTTICAALSRLRWRLPAPPAHWVSAAAVIVALVCLAGIYFALPVRYTVPHPPLDGQTGFFQLWADSDRVLHDAIIVAGFVGLLASCFLPGFAHRPGLIALALFPFATLLPVLIIAQFPDWKPPFHPQHVWDLAKDVPNWCFGFYFGLFALIAVEAVGRVIEHVVQRRAVAGGKLAARLPAWLPQAIVTAAGVLALATTLDRPHIRHGYHLKRPAHFTRVGGHQDPLFARLVERFATEQKPPARPVRGNQKGRLFVSATSEVNSRRHDFGMYGINVRSDWSPGEPQDLAALEQGRAILVAPPDEAAALEQAHERLHVELLEPLTLTACVYLITPDQQPTPTAGQPRKSPFRTVSHSHHD
ncbi:MAG TPA: hypothetical protein VFV87_04230 [Pirellulaceae bacterium]|nr:hypothetical protein [Pirellulaceae bacterium]